MKKLIAILLISMLAFVSMGAEAAKRMGGGKSMGQQNSNVNKKQAAPPAQNTPPAAAAAPTPSRPWGAMLGGLAAGLGLAWLASSLGLGAAFGNILMALLIGAAVLVLIGYFMRKRQNTMAVTQPNLAYQGAGNLTAQPTRFTGGSMIGSALAPAATWGIPQGFDAAGFESAARSTFVSLQDAWSVADLGKLQNMMTDGMLTEISEQLSQRDSTESYRVAVMALEAKLLGVTETDTEFVSSVEFTGTMQEAVGEAPVQFEEVWNMTKSKTGGGWLLAGIQTYGA